MSPESFISSRYFPGKSAPMKPAIAVGTPRRVAVMAMLEPVPPREVFLVTISTVSLIVGK